MRLTEKCLKHAKTDSKPIKLFDGGGLYLEVMPSGGKLWRLKYRYDGKEKRISLGSYPLTTLKEARERRDAAKKKLENNIDPSIAKQEEKAKALLESNLTFELMAREWHENTKEKWTARHAKYVLSRMERHLFPHIGKLPIKSITPPILLNALKQVEKNGIYETTKRVRQYASKVFKYAIITGRAEKDVSEHLSGVLKTKRAKHHAIFDISELPEFLNRIRSNEQRIFFQTQMAIELMVLTFVRTSELLEAEKGEFDLREKVWVIPGERMKMGNTHIVPLAEQTIKIVERLFHKFPGSKYLLPSPMTSEKPINNNAIISTLYRMKYQGKATGHGFRALAMTAIKEKLGYRHEVVDRQLAHAHRNSVDAAYDRAQFLDERKIMMQDWADYIDKI